MDSSIFESCRVRLEIPLSACSMPLKFRSSQPVILDHVGKQFLTSRAKLINFPGLCKYLLQILLTEEVIITPVFR